MTTSLDPADGTAGRNRLAAIVLAAGRSTRAGGRHKVLGRIDARTMVRLAAEAALASGADPVVVVVGHRAAEVASALSGLPLQIVENPDYADGLSSSLRAGILALPDDVAGAAIMLADMPGVTAAIVERVFEAFQALDKAEIIVPTHHGKRGNPVIWARRFFPQLAGVSGDRGGRALLVRFAASIVEVECAAGVLVDLDTADALSEAGTVWD